MSEERFRQRATSREVPTVAGISTPTVPNTGRRSVIPTTRGAASESIGVPGAQEYEPSVAFQLAHPREADQAIVRTV